MFHVQVNFDAYLLESEDHPLFVEIILKQVDCSEKIEQILNCVMIWFSLVSFYFHPDDK